VRPNIDGKFLLAASIHEARPMSLGVAAARCTDLALVQYANL
jgi:hypothetical protein